MSGITSAFSVATAGLDGVANQLANTSQRIANYGTQNPGPDTLVNDIVDLSTEKTAFKADVLVLKSAGQMLGTLLDVFDTPKR